MNMQAAPVRKMTPKAAGEAAVALAKHKITPCLWFDTQAEDAAKFYCSVFPNAKLGRTSSSL